MTIFLSVLAFAISLYCHVYFKRRRAVGMDLLSVRLHVCNIDRRMKPLYEYMKGDTIYTASTIQALTLLTFKLHTKLDAIDINKAYRYYPERVDSIYSQIEELKLALININDKLCKDLEKRK